MQHVWSKYLHSVSFVVSIIAHRITDCGSAVGMLLLAVTLCTLLMWHVAPLCGVVVIRVNCISERWFCVALFALSKSRRLIFIIYHRNAACVCVARARRLIVPVMSVKVLCLAWSCRDYNTLSLSQLDIQGRPQKSKTPVESFLNLPLKIDFLSQIYM